MIMIPEVTDPFLDHDLTRDVEAIMTNVDPDLVSIMTSATM